MKLHELGYVAVVTADDGEEYVYDDVIDFGLQDDGNAIRVKTEAHPYLLFEPLPDQLSLIKEDAL